MPTDHPIEQKKVRKHLIYSADKNCSAMLFFLIVYKNGEICQGSSDFKFEQIANAGKFSSLNRFKNTTKN